MFFAATIGKQLTSHLPSPERARLVKVVKERSGKWSCQALDSLAETHGFANLTLPATGGPDIPKGRSDEVLSTPVSTTQGQERKKYHCTFVPRDFAPCIIVISRTEHPTR
jgi:hypothetical protein